MQENLPIFSLVPLKLELLKKTLKKNVLSKKYGLSCSPILNSGSKNTLDKETTCQDKLLPLPYHFKRTQALASGRLALLRAAGIFQRLNVRHLKILLLRIKKNKVYDTLLCYSIFVKFSLLQALYYTLGPSFSEGSFSKGENVCTSHNISNFKTFNVNLNKAINKTTLIENKDIFNQ